MIDYHHSKSSSSLLKSR